ncbi:MAG: DUF2961 domain-containing protein [Bacteroidota bacterium]
MNKHILLFLLLKLIVCLPFLNAQTSKQEERPNILIIFTDDQGYGDLSCFGSKIRTPNIDRLATEGTRFTSAYAQVVCGPSRSALLTGRYPVRSGGWSMPASEITLAELMQENGYTTGCVGKWDVSNRAAIIDRMPNAKGFDYYWGTLGANDNEWMVYHHNNEEVGRTEDMASITRIYTDKAIGFLEENKDKPFLLYLAHSMLHSVIDASPEFKGKSREGLYGDAVEELDFHTGRLLDALEELGLKENTLVLFTTDNGPWSNHVESLSKKHDGALAWGSPGPLRGAKGSTYEGGIRVPTIARWPENIPAGRVSDAIFSTLDFMPTFANLTGYPVPEDRVIDGVDQTDLLLGRNEAGARDHFYYFSRNELQAVRMGKWKLRLPNLQKFHGYLDDMGSQETELYNLDEDIGELKNLAAQHPDIVNQLQQKIKAFSWPDDKEKEGIYLGPELKRYSYPDLVNKLYDMEQLAVPPVAAEASGNFSSYDRKSQYDPQTETYVNWTANRDGTGFVRKEGNGIVIFDKTGPGVIWRVWSALAQTGHIKIYIDFADEPVVDMPFSDFFDKINDDGPPPKSLPGIPSINLPNLMPTLSRGRNRFIPIPYQRHCKIVLEEGWGMYYHVTHSSYPLTTRLPKFDGTYYKDACIALAEADRVLANRGYDRKSYDKEAILQKRAKLGAGATKTVSVLTGNRAITHFSINYDKYVYDSEQEKEELLKNIWLKITWDDESEAAVFAPIGLYFGTYPNVYPYRSYPIGALPGHLYSNWYMPFSQKAKIELVNKGSKSHQLKMDIAHIPLQESANDLLRFHAKWHDGKYKEQVQSDGRDKDWPLLLTQGKGRFCGLSLHIQNEWEEPEEEVKNWWYGKWGYKNINWWWGEGDEKFYVDGEKFPSTFGTGSEDYIGYAWSAEPPFALFDSPFAAQPFTAIDGNGHTIVSRFHIADNIPFQRSFTAVIDKYKEDQWGDRNICLFQAVGYWYLAPGQKDGY